MACAREYGLNESSVRTIKKCEKDIRHAVTHRAPVSAKVAHHIRNTALNQMEKGLNVWIEDLNRRLARRFGGAPVRRHRRIVLFHLPANVQLDDSPVCHFADTVLLQYVIQTLYLYDFFFLLSRFFAEFLIPKLPSKLISSVFTSIYQCISASYQFSFNKSYEKLSSATLLYRVSGVIINRDRNNLLPRNLH